jgi:hypothetical protein
VSIPPSDKAKVAAVRFPARVSVNVIPRADCRGVEWFCGDTEWMKGRSASRAVYNEEGIDSGSVPRNGESTEGVDSCRDLRRGEDKPLGKKEYLP